LRRETRFPSDKAVKVVVCGEQEAVVGGRIVNASENGLGLTQETPTQVGSQVRIDVDDMVLAGEVVHCQGQGNGYAVGLRLAAPLPKE
jgi:CTP-dependent riboflavin kinase